MANTRSNKRKDLMRNDTASKANATSSSKRGDFTRNDTASKADATTSNKCKDLTRNDTPDKADATTSSGASALLSSSVANSPLFKLSPELRNRIYRLVLVIDHNDFFTSDFVTVDKANGIPEPALLLTSKAIRSETSGIFYHENSFDCEIIDYDPVPMLLLQSKFKMPYRDLPIDVFTMRSKSGPAFQWNYYDRWKNLILWLHMCHRGECAAPDGEEHGRYTSELALVEGLFEVAKKGPEISSGMLQCVIESMSLAFENAVYSDMC
jgi:hypothetical protein